MVKLHYIGKLYSIKKFEQESIKYGVSRAIPLHLLNKIKFGEKIYLGQWNFTEEITIDEENELTKRIGVANIFGYFIVNGLNLPDEITEKLLPKLNVKSVSEPSHSQVERGCGSYGVIAVVFVDNSMEEILQVLKETMKDLNLKNVKVFLTGVYHPIIPHLEIQDMEFSRTFIDLPYTKNGELLEVEKQIKFIEDYKRIKYRTKKKKLELENQKYIDLYI